MSPSSLTCYFDPTCPWTWMTSRWLVDEAARRRVPLRWRAFSLRLARDGEVPAGQEDAMALSDRFLRVAEAVADDATVSELYRRVGTALHVEGRPPSPELLDDALAAIGHPGLVEVADDDASSAPVEEAFDEARELVGDDVGSPILAWGEPPIAIFGPIVNPIPRDEEAARLWDAVIAAASVPSFSELKRTRERPPRPRG